MMPERDVQRVWLTARDGKANIGGQKRKVMHRRTQRGKDDGNALAVRAGFLARDLGSLSKVRNAIQEWIGVYGHAYGGEELVGASRSRQGCTTMPPPGAS